MQIRYLRQIFLDEKEIFFIKNYVRNNEKTKANSYSLVQCPMDFNYLKVFKNLTEDNNDKFKGVIPVTFYSRIIEIGTILPTIAKNIYYCLVSKKWKKLYSPICNGSYYYSRRLVLSKKIICLLKAIKYFNLLKSKKQLLSHVYRGIKCGDLIYDSYLRFHKKPTVNIYDLNLIIYIYDCYCNIHYYLDVIKSQKFNSYFTSYSSYISHGIPVRVFLKNNINVYSIIFENEKNFYIKQLTKTDFHHIKSHWNFRKIFEGLSNQSSLKKNGFKKFGERFKGINDLEYMKKNLYSSKVKNIFKEQYDTVIFLHDFGDSPHCNRHQVFEDFYEWFFFTVDILKSSNISFGIKPHPNQVKSSENFIKKLMIDFSDSNWISADINNSEIFNSGIKFGLSVYGTVLAELAYHRIIPIACGDNPASSFDFVFEAKTKDEYVFLIKNYSKLKFRNNLKDQLGEYYYMNYIFKEHQTIN